MDTFKKNFKKPDEIREFDKGKVELVYFNGITVGLVTLQPGWKWSECVKPIAHTPSCLAPHTGYMLSGRMRVLMDDGTSMDLEQGDAMIIPPGHDAWVLGDETCISLDFTGMEKYAKEGESESEST